MLTLRTALCLSFVGLGLGACYRPGDLGDTPYLCTSERPACPDGYVCAVSLGTCVRKSANSRRAITMPKTGSAAPAPTTAREAVGGCPDKAGPGDLPEAEVELLDDELAEDCDGQGLESETAAAPLDCGP
jgi:hypothetical protein